MKVGIVFRNEMNSISVSVSFLWVTHHSVMLPQLLMRFHCFLAHSKAIKGVATDSVNLVAVSGSSDGFIKVTNAAISLLKMLKNWIFACQ